MKSLPSASTRIQHRRTAIDLLSRFSGEGKSKKADSDVYERAKWKAKFLLKAAAEDAKSMHTPFSNDVCDRKYSSLTDDSNTHSKPEETTLTSNSTPNETHTSPTNQSSLQPLALPVANKRMRRPRKRDNCTDLAGLVKDCHFGCPLSLLC